MYFRAFVHMLSLENIYYIKQYLSFYFECLIRYRVFVLCYYFFYIISCLKYYIKFWYIFFYLYNFNIFIYMYSYYFLYCIVFSLLFFYVVFLLCSVVFTIIRFMYSVNQTLNHLGFRWKCSIGMITRPFYPSMLIQLPCCCCLTHHPASLHLPDISSPCKNDEF